MDARLRFERFNFKEGLGSKTLLEVGPDEIHIWGLSLEINGVERAHAAGVLSEVELERVNRMLSDQHRQHFMGAHAALRFILSGYCGQPPQELVIEKSSAGKPFLPDHPLLQFNLTHSHARALIAIVKNRNVGIDVEKIRCELDVGRLANRFLSNQDRAFIESGDSADRNDRFMRLWVAREAVLKAVGTGITFPLHHDYVELSSDGETARMITGEGGDGLANVLIRFLPVDAGWVGAVAARGSDWTVTYCRF